MLPPLLPLTVLLPSGAELVRRAFSFCEDLLVLIGAELYGAEYLVVVEVVEVLFGVNRFSGEAGGVS